MLSTSASAESARREEHETSRQNAVHAARAILDPRAPQPRAQEVFDIAGALKRGNEFGYARRLLKRLWSSRDTVTPELLRTKVGQQYAMCTYKDPDLPAAERLRTALEILREVDAAPDQNPAERQESFGLKGAIYKRLWQQEAQSADLERSLACYLAGYEIGPTIDRGYTGINAAFVLDLLARDHARATAHITSDPTNAESFARRARAIRESLRDSLPALAEREPSLKVEWWFQATLAEVHFGLRDFPQGIRSLRDFNAHAGLIYEGPPRERVEPWELESTISQLAAVAQLQADLAGTGPDASPPAAPASASPAGLHASAAHALRDYLGDLAPAAERAFTGKLGLALSGGGLRAALFHLGVLASLAERDLLRRVETLSCVSGGSVVGTHLYLEVRKLLESRPDHEITAADYVELVQRLETEFLAGVQRNIRCRLYGSFWANLRAFLPLGYSTTRRLGVLFERELFARVKDGRGSRPRHLHDLFVRPAGEAGSFKPKYDNWRRSAKVPTLVLNATTLNTGHNWQFTASWMGEPPASVADGIDGNYRLRRVYLHDAPRRAPRWDRWYRKPFAPPDYRNFRLGEAVAASSCVPVLFEPLVLDGLYDGKSVRLVDGGVFDNQGISSLLAEDCGVMVVSDASGQMDAQDVPSSGRLGILGRSFDISSARVRLAEHGELAARSRTGLLKGKMFLHLKRDLDAAEVSWLGNNEPDDDASSTQATSSDSRTSYGIDKHVQRLLSGVRSDLDSFTDVEAFALMTSGYRQAESQVGCLPQGMAAERRSAGNWRFLEIGPLLDPVHPGHAELVRQLHIGGSAAGKVWRLVPALRVLGIALAAVVVIGLFLVGYSERDRVLLTVGTLGTIVLTFGAVAIAPRLMRLLQVESTVRDLALRSIGSAVLSLAFKIQLLVFDPFFLRVGRVERLLRSRGPRS